MIQTFSIKIPLPPSKNARHGMRLVRRKPRFGEAPGRAGGTIPITYITKEVRNFRTEVNLLWLGRNDRPRFESPKQIMILCGVCLRRANADVMNIVDELSDTLQIALGINDKYFTIFSYARKVDPKNDGIDMDICWGDGEWMTEEECQQVAGIISDRFKSWFSNK